MPKWKIVATIKGGAGKMTVPSPNTIEAETIQDALEILAKSNLPGNDLIETVGVSLELVEDEGDTDQQ